MKAQVGGVWKTEMDGVIVKTPVGEGKGGGGSREDTGGRADTCRGES